MTGPDRRLSAWALSTLAVLVLLFRYPTSTGTSPGRHIEAGIAPVGVVADAPAPATAQSPSVAAAPPRPGPPSARPPAAARHTPAAIAAPQATHRAASTAPVPRRAAPVPRKTSARPTQATNRTINGAAVDTRYGPVQVQIKVSGSRIVSANAIVYPTESSRDRQINDRAIPQLNDETLQAQSANIDTVSGASYTSDGYRQSLQSALDAAHR